MINSSDWQEAIDQGWLRQAEFILDKFVEEVESKLDNKLEEDLDWFEKVAF